MSEAEVETAPHTGWLETWLSSVAEADDMRLRANAAVALATLGGPARIAQFADLVGDTALKLREGKSGAANVLHIALGETKRRGFDRKSLKDVLNAPGPQSDARKAARALLGEADPLTAWWRLRRVAVRPHWARSLGLALQYSIGGAFALWAAIWLLIDRRTQNFSNIGYLVVAALIVATFAFGAARLATPGLRTRVALLMDGLFCGLALAVPAGLLLLFISADRTTSDQNSGALLGWLAILAAMAAVMALRVAVGLAPASQGRLVATLSAIAWPIFGVTAAGMAVTWLFGGGAGAKMTAFSDDDLSMVSWIWIGSILFAPTFVAQVRATDELRPPEVARLFPFSIPPLLAAAGLLLLLVPTILLSTRAPVTEFNVGGPGGLPGPFAVSTDQAFRLRLADEKQPMEIAFDDEAKDLVLKSRGATLPVIGERKEGPAPPMLSSDSDLAKPSLSPLGKHFRVEPRQARALCLGGAKQVRCGVPTLEPGAWLRILSGRTATLVDTSEQHFFVVPIGDPAPQQAVSIPLADLAGSVAQPIPLTPTADRRVLAMDAPGDLVMTVTPKTPDSILDRVVIVQAADPKTYQVWSNDDPGQPRLQMRLTAGQRYLICMRLVTATFLDCTHPTRGLLSDPLLLSFSSNAPAQDEKSDPPTAGPEPFRQLLKRRGSP